MVIEVTTVPLVVITGPVGAGKSTVLDAISDLLVDKGIPHAAIDMDHLRVGRPPPPDDRFGEQAGHRNLAALWPLLVADGARWVLLADVVENKADYLTAIAEGLPDAAVTIVRLDVPLRLIRRRIRAREPSHRVNWHLARAPELQSIMQLGRVEDVLIEVADRDQFQVAVEVVQRLGIE